jgi:hypothetical protein
MAKKAKKEGGKIAFIDAALASGKYTKSEIARSLAGAFLVNEKTAKNTVSWCASTYQKRNGKAHKAKV